MVTKPTADKSADASTAIVAEKISTEQEQGYRGHVVDPTPNENYTVAGVTSGKPTPETDSDAREAARRARADAVES